MKHFPPLTRSIAPSSAFVLLLTQSAWAQVSEADLDPVGDEPSETATSPETTAEDQAAATTAPADDPTNAAPSEAKQSEVEHLAPTAATTTNTPPLSEEPATPPLAEEPQKETEPTSSDEDVEAFLQKPPTPFDQGRIRIGVGLGWSSSANTDWLILGGGLGYYLIDGLEAAVDSTFWVIGDPFIATLTPGIRYVFVQLPSVKPYVGAFYRHYFVGDEYSDTDSLGGRLGVYFMLSKSAYVGGGIVYEHFLDDDLFTSRDQFYPEITFSFSL